MPRKPKNVPVGGLTIQHALFADLVSAGIGYSEAYRKAFPDSYAKPESINVIACRLAARPDVKARIEELKRQAQQQPISRDARLLNGEWLKLEILNGYYQIATGSDSESLRLQAWDRLAQTRIVDLMAPKVQSGGVNVNVQTNQLAAPAGNQAGQLRAELVRELHALAAPSEDVIEAEEE